MMIMIPCTTYFFSSVDSGRKAKNKDVETTKWLGRQLNNDNDKDMDCVHVHIFNACIRKM